jgi:diguanylate cyclase (GGDEF)-like protein
MDPTSPVTDFAALYMQEIGAVLFGLVFWFLWHQSRAVYFGLWSVAWGLRSAATAFGFLLSRDNAMVWLALYATFESAFAIVLIAAARAGFQSQGKDWRTVLRLIAVLPIFVALVYAIGHYSSLEAYQASNAMVLGLVYLYNYLLLRRERSIGFRVFRFSLVMLAAAFFAHAAMFIYLFHSGGVLRWAAYLRQESYYDFALHCVLAFSAMAMWSETQIDRIHDLIAELDGLRRERKHGVELDHLTGLLNQAALARRVEEPGVYEGVVTVCDMDNFKDINDRFGHLVGDEILRNVGHLLHNSIRHEDEAYRWGGDEFVILFRNQNPEIARKRMVELEGRLRNFRVRGFGVLPISFSWGVTDARGRALRDALDEADRHMYQSKRAKSEEGARERPPVV